MIIPKEDIIEEIAIPQNRLNPPLAEVLANLIALLTKLFLLRACSPNPILSVIQAL